MTTRTKMALAISFAISFLAVGVPYWQIPYSRVSLPDTLYSFGLVVVFAFSAVARILAGARLLPTTVVIGAAAPCAVLARVTYETSIDPTSHNLWPFEIVIASAVGVLAALCGALVGGLLASTQRRLRSDRGVS
jgi:hypothetical protein